jgi:hypothetical protein
MVAVPSVFEVVVPDSIWVTERPVWFGGVRLRSRTTVVRLSRFNSWPKPGASQFLLRWGSPVPRSS